MAAQQTSYALELVANSQPGFIRSTDNKRVKPYRNDNAGSLAHGILLCRSANTDLKGADLPATTKQILGVNSFSQRFESSNGVPTKEMANVLTQGEVNVSVSEAVTPDDPVRVTIATGVFCKTSSAGVTALVPGAKFLTSSATLAGLEINFPSSIVKLVAD